jgi:hypothetical protein
MMSSKQDLLRLRYKIICKTGSLGPFCRAWGVSPDYFDFYMHGCIAQHPEEIEEVMGRLERGLACI